MNFKILSSTKKWRERTLFLCALVLFNGSIPAHAGSWKVDHYIVNGNSHGEEYFYNNNWAKGSHKYSGTNHTTTYQSGTSTPTDLKAHKDVNAEAINYIVGTQPFNAGVTDLDGQGNAENSRIRLNRGNLYQDGQGITGVTAFQTLTVRAVFKWQPAYTNEPPADTFYIVEHAYASASGDGNTPDGTLPADYPEWTGNEYSFETLETGLEDQESATTKVNDIQIYKNAPSGNSSRVHVLAKDSQLVTVLRPGIKTTIVGPARTLDGKITLNSPKVMDWPMNQSEGELLLNYRADIAHFQLFGRRMGEEPVTDLTSRFSELGDTIAAGGKESKEHKLEVVARLSTSDDNGTLYPVEGIPLAAFPELIIKKEVGYKGANGSLTNTDAQVTNSVAGAATRSNADGRIMRGIVVPSRNLTDDAPNNITSVEITAYGGPVPSLPVHQAWDQNNRWETRDTVVDPNNPTVVISHGEWFSGFPIIDLDVYDQYREFRFKPQLNQTVNGKSSPIPITGHTMKFLVPRVRVHEWNPVNGTNNFIERTVIYTDDPTEVNSSNPSLPIEYKSDLSSYVLTSPSETGDDGDGNYQSSIRLCPPSKLVDQDLWKVEQVWLCAEDKGTYKP